MGAPAGHPFFGNKYTDGGYVRGTYTYVVEKGKEIIKPFLKEASQAATHAATKQKPVNLIPKKFVAKIFTFDNAITFIAVATAVAPFITNEFLRNKAKEKQDSIQSIELQNVGICTYCGEPLNDSTYIPEGEEDGHNAYIICKKCGEKNFARYTDKNDSEASNADE
jgi:DNA-directed RNA polymerase subunit RPC12/RpoP